MLHRFIKTGIRALHLMGHLHVENGNSLQLQHKAVKHYLNE